MQPFARQLALHPPRRFRNLSQTSGGVEVLGTSSHDLVTETMASHHALSMDSYDRLFPSQDTMPRGGFGNLIALPLQHGPRQVGNSVFLDETLNAYPDDQHHARRGDRPIP